MAVAGAGTTVVSTDAATAIKLFSVSLSAEVEKRSIYIKMMTGKKSTMSMATAKRERQQTAPEMPIVMINDLAQQAGDRVTCDLFHIVQGEPVMGDRVIEGRGAPMSFDTMEVKIDQTRFPIDAGSKMTQKRTRWNLRRIARSNMASWFARTNDQVIQVHLAGARGSENTEDWNVPLSSHPNFSEIMVNPVEPPTSNRYFVAGGGTSVSDIGSTDALRLEDLDVISTTLRDMTFPPSPIMVENDPEAEIEPIWCLLVTERQWHYILSRSGSNTQAWRRFLGEAQMRASKTRNHPLFTGTTGLWNGLLIKRMPRAIRFNRGDTVQTTNSDDGTLTNSTVGVASVDRAILLGGQALACAKGDAGGSRSGYPMKWTEVLRDHYNSVEIGAGQVDGKRKFRFRGSDDKITDLGVAVIDSYAPDPRSAEGETLRSSLRS